MYKIESKKDSKKLFRTLLEFSVIILVAYLLFNVFFANKKYVPYEENGDVVICEDEDNGFICLSYFGVDRTGTDTLTSTKRLKEHLSMLKQLGYVTITQQDVLDYYNGSKKLPEKSLFLIFEDGRSDTAVFSEPIIESLNYKATICSYAEKFEVTDSKFLSGKDLKKMEKTTFFENGTNGYRLSYINAFDRYDRFLGNLNSWEFISINQYLGRNYNHYLMDFIRDENDIPVESNARMTERISFDYELMEKLYTEKLGYVPKLYILMHSNTDRFGNNQNVSDVNEECLKSLFDMNVNREGFAVNDENVNIYDLTRLQSQSYWYTNHLLMRIWDDLDDSQKDNILFVKGDTSRYNKWDTILGASEFKENQIVVTSLPKSKGIISLKESEQYKNISVETKITGNLYGIQKIRLRADKDTNSGVELIFCGRNLSVYDNGALLSDINLDEALGIQYNSVEEDSRAALAAEYRARADYAGSVRESNAYKNESNEAKRQPVKSVEDGGEPYVPEIEINTPGNRKVRIYLYEDKLTVYVDDVIVVDSLAVNAADSGKVYLESEWPEEAYRQRNLTDDVYDAVFENFVINEIDSDFNEIKNLYDDRLTGLEKVKYTTSKYFNRVVDWFVANL